MKQKTITMFAKILMNNFSKSSLNIFCKDKGIVLNMQNVCE